MCWHDDVEDLTLHGALGEVQLVLYLWTHQLLQESSSIICLSPAAALEYLVQKIGHWVIFQMKGQSKIVFPARNETSAQTSGSRTCVNNLRPVHVWIGSLWLSTFSLTRTLNHSNFFFHCTESESHKTFILKVTYTDETPSDQVQLTVSR